MKSIKLTYVEIDELIELISIAENKIAHTDYDNAYDVQKKRFEQVNRYRDKLKKLKRQ